LPLSLVDWIIIIAFMGIILFVGISYRKKSAKGLASFFLGGRNLPWYLAGISMVATTFAADTLLAVTELVGINGISGNWLWWNFLAGGMLTTFFFANLWRRANIVTEVEFIELRYSGKPAAFLRGFKAIYLGVIMNVLIIGWVNLAMMTILEGFFDISTGWALFYTGLMTVFVAIYASLSGLLGVVVTDAIQFVIAMMGSIILAVLVINTEQIGGIEGLKEQLPEGTLNFLPAINSSNTSESLAISGASFLAFFGFVWWASWYPGQEPGGGGYIAQRMMSTKNEKHAVGATLLFQIAHYCIRPWPWILVGLAAIVLYALPPQIQDHDVLSGANTLIEQGVDPAFFGVDDAKFNKMVADDSTATFYQNEITALRSTFVQERANNQDLDQALVYGADKRFGYVFAMKNHLPKGLMGLLLAAFFAAFMSTISTQLNWGASYVVNDVYKRFMAPDATEKKLIAASRISTILLMVVGLVVTTQINSISAVWRFIMECGAGLGMVLILRWYWWRINAWSEIVATIAPFIGYTIAYFILEIEFPYSFFFTVGFTTISWLLATFITSAEPQEKLASFYTRIKPDGWWKQVGINALDGEEAPKSNMLNLAVCWLSAVGFTYSFLFFIGKLLLHEWLETLYSFGALTVFLVILLTFIKRTKIFT
jgi:SSS family solute:Na+ symporter